DLYDRDRSNSVRSGNTVYYYSAVFPVRHYGSDTGRSAGNGTFRGAYDSVRDRYGRNEDCVDLRILSAAQISAFPVYLISGILDYYNCDAGGMLLVCKEEMRKAAAECEGIGYGTQADI